MTSLTIPKIFQIGFNLTDSLSLHNYLLCNGIKSIFGDSGKLAISMVNNSLAGADVFYNYEGYDAFFDMEAIDETGSFIYAYQYCLDKIIAQYPAALYIFNTQNVDNWIQRRSELYGYLPSASKFLKCSELEVKEKWKKDFEDHTVNVLKKFKGCDNFLIHNIDTDGIENINNFFNRHSINLDPTLYKPYNETRGSTDLSYHIKNIREAALFFKYHKDDLNTAIQLLELAQQHRPCSSFFKNELFAWTEIKNNHQNNDHAK
ncbi:hypothetical protein [Cellvibrio mixtus]|uniref:hypothetical protein n=1 Tax=Cellvibrio mixtus TaxID=39650 RepID=UPI000587E7BC|nr:hypothetical protein [Cellvibrio mixtus]